MILLSGYKVERLERRNKGGQLWENLKGVQARGADQQSAA